MTSILENRGQEFFPVPLCLFVGGKLRLQAGVFQCETYDEKVPKLEMQDFLNQNEGNVLSENNLPAIGLLKAILMDYLQLK